MRSTMFLALLFIIIAAVNSGPLPSNKADENKADELVQDGNNDLSKIAVEDGKGAVKLIGRGYVELMVTSDSLFVGVNIKKCIGTVLFCYAAKSGESQTMDDAKALCRGLSNFCGFRLIGSKHDNKIKFTRDQRFEKNNLDDCLNDIKMTFGSTKYCKDISDASCNAAISAEDGRIRIHVKDADPDNCPVSIKNAKIYVPPTTPIPSTAPPSMATSSNKTITNNDDKAAEASSQELTWIVLGCLIGLIVLVLVLLEGMIFLCWLKNWCMFKKKTGENLPPLHPVESIVSATVEAKAEEKIEKAYEKIKSEHPELKEVISKKSKKAQPAPPPPSAKQVKKSPPPALGKSAKKEKKAKTPPPPTVAAAAPSKKDAKEKKAAPASPEKKSVGKKAAVPSAEKKSVEKKAASSKETTEKPCSSTQSYSPEFCILAVRTPSPPRQPVDPEVLRERRRRRKENDSLELYAAERERKHKAACEAIKNRHNWM